MIDVVALSAPLDGAMPAGPDLEYENEFLALEADARGKPERQFGDTVIKATEADWADIRERAAALMARTRDLRLACLLTRAQTRTEGLPGLANGMALVARLCETLWPSVHPQLDPDEPGDATLRLNVLSVLADGGGLLQDLRLATLVAARGFGHYSVRDAEIALGVLPAPVAATSDDDDSPRAPAVPAIEPIAAAIRAAHPQGDDPVAAAIAAAQSLKAALASVGAEIDLDPLLRRLRPLARLFEESRAGLSAADEAAGQVPGDGIAHEAGGADAAASAGSRPGPRLPSSIGSRDEAVRVLERVCEYLDRQEPTNPAPLLIRRAQRLMTMNFLDIVREMAPEGLDSLHKIAGIGPPAE